MLSLEEKPGQKKLDRHIPHPRPVVGDAEKDEVFLILILNYAYPFDAGAVSLL